MGDRIRRLNEIAQQGDIEAFYNLISEDEKLLERIDKFPFFDTPLHKSASAGHFLFSCEMMILKPSFVSKRNPKGLTPIHLALENNRTDMVRQLLQHNADLVRVKGKECMTPLHYAATKNDNLALLENFLSVCPDSITDVTIRNETALHIALNSDNLEAFKFLVGWLLRKWPYWKEILQLKDVEGKTILHIAVSKNQTQAVSHLLALGPRFVNIEKNLGAQTASDILDEQRRQGVDNREMKDILERAGALIPSSHPTVTSSYAHYLRLPGLCERAKIIYIGNQVMKRMTDERRNALLVVAALLVTLTFQTAITPPGGLWQDDAFQSNATDALLRTEYDLYKLNITAPHRAGSAIALHTTRFAAFEYLNSLIFYSSIVAMHVLIQRADAVGLVLGGVSLWLIGCYSCSMGIIDDVSDQSQIILFLQPIVFFIAMVVTFIAVTGLNYLLNLIRKELKKIYSRAWSYCI